MVIFYSLDIFKRANVQMNNYALSIMVQSGFLVGYIISSFLMVRTPRKLQFIASGLFMSASLVALGFILNVEVSYVPIKIRSEIKGQYFFLVRR